jgi:hypothetical protein
MNLISRQAKKFALPELGRADQPLKIARAIQAIIQA